MKQRRLLALTLALILLCSLLSGCGLLSYLAKDRADTEGDMPPFGEIEYERPDLDAMLAEADALIETLSAEQKPRLRAVTDALDALFTDFRHLRTMETIATIRSDTDVTDTFYRDEAEWCGDAEIAMRGKFEEVFAACAASKIKSGLDLYFGAGFLDDYGEDYVYPEALIALQKRENELIHRYYTALSSARFTWNGEDYTISELYQLEQKGALEGIDFSDALAQYYTETNRTLGGIFVELVKLRHELAEEAGYDSFVEMAYDQNGRDYTPEDTADYNAAILSELVPLYREAQESGLADDAFYGTPELDPDESLQNVAAIADAMGGDIADTADFLLAYDLVNADLSELKGSDSYEIYLPDYEAPYILANTVGYAEDILTIAHELGHATDDFIYYEAADSTDVSETISQAMEYLVLPYLEGGSYESVIAYKLADVLTLYAQQGSYNAFEERVYALEDDAITLENINAIALQTAKDYGVASEWGNTYDAASWVEITHFFQQPFYIVSYLASDSLAIQFYEQELADQGKGLELYKKCLSLAGDTPFTSLSLRLGLRDPLSAEQVRAIAKLIRQQLF